MAPKEKIKGTYVGSLNLECSLGDLALGIQACIERYGKDAILKLDVRHQNPNLEFVLKASLSYDPIVITVQE